MKITCDCGNEVKLVQPDDAEERIVNEEEGMCVHQNDRGKFDFWEQHDVVGIVCNECKKAVWMFT